MPSISNRRLLAQVRVNLIPLASESVELEAQGLNLRGACPLHPDKNRGLYVMPSGRFHCFSCGAGGDVVDWTMLVESVDEKMAIERLIARQSPPADGPRPTSS